MTGINLTFDCAEAGRDLATFTVGLAKMSVNGRVEDAVPAGSGTLVTVGTVAGILTAAHVVKNLPDRKEVALMRFPGKPQLLQKQTIDMALAQKLVIAAGDEGPGGPDLAFLRLPMVNVDNLKATNSFLNIGARRGVIPPVHKGSAYVDAVIGVVAEWTKDLPSRRPNTRIKGFELLFCGGTTTAKYKVGEFDLCTFEPSFGEGIRPPSSYGGVSGGGLWRIYFVPDGSNRVLEKRLAGIAFYEVADTNSAIRIICHGPRSIYEHVVPKIMETWPDAGRS
jgi:hypothetical protein